MMIMIMSTHRQQNKKCIHVQCKVSYSCHKSKQLETYYFRFILYQLIRKTVNSSKCKISDITHNKEPIAKTVETEADHVIMLMNPKWVVITTTRPTRVSRVPRNNIVNVITYFKTPWMIIDISNIDSQSDRWYSESNRTDTWDSCTSYW
jgi:hypothetical protein